MTRINKELVKSMMEVAGYEWEQTEMNIPKGCGHDANKYMLTVLEYEITFIPNSKGEYAIDVYNLYLDRHVKKLTTDDYCEIIEAIKADSLILEQYSSLWYN